MRILMVITGILLIVTSIFCFANPGAVFLTMAFVIGCVMVFAGVAGCCAYFFAKERQEGAVWILMESGLTLILGCIVLSNQLATDAVIPLFFGMWLLFTGILRIGASFAMKKAEDKYWAWILGLGVLSCAGGIYSFFNPILAAFAIVLLVGIFVLIQGVNVLAYGISMPGKKRK